MNSFNHYSYGAVGDWMYRRIAGLDMGMEEPAYRHIHLEPQFGGRQLTYAKATHESMYGRIECGWELDGEHVIVQVTIPVNTAATLRLRGAILEQLTENGDAIPSIPASGIRNVQQEVELVQLELGSGSYCFRYPAKGLFQRSYTEHTRLSELQLDEQAISIVNQHAPQLLSGALTSIVSQSSLRQITDNQMTRVSENTLKHMLKELQMLP